MSPPSPGSGTQASEGRHEGGLIHTTHNNDTQYQNATAHHGGGHGGNSTENNQPPVHRLGWYLPRVGNAIVIAVILLLTVYHLITILRHKHTLKQRSKDSIRKSKLGEHQHHQQHHHHHQSTETPSSSNSATAGQGDDDSDTLINAPMETTSQPKKKRKYRVRAWNAMQRNWLYLSAMPGWLYGPETVMDAGWTILYCASLTVLACWNGSWERRLYVANQMGIMAYSQVPIIIILIQKNNPISFLTGITYQKLNYLHRASSRACLLFSWIHFLVWTPRVWEAGHFRRWYIIFGLAAIFGFTGLWVTSFRVVRRIAFEFFLVAHIVFSLVFIVGGILHWHYLAYWLWPALVIWGGDRLLRFFWLLWINPPKSLRWFKSKKQPAQAGECTIRLLAHDVMLLTARRPGLKWSAGQHFFLSAPSVSTSPHESHPFSIANMPNERDEAVFLVRVHNGFTRRLRDKLSGDVTTDIPIYLEGPYGTSHALYSYSTVILIAGGTGITFCSSHLLGLLHSTTPQISRHVHMIWHIRHSEDVSWLAPLLNEVAALAPRHPQTRLTLDVYVTKSHRSDEPAPMAGLTERLVDEFAPRRFSRRFSRNVPKFEAVSELPSAIGSDDEDGGVIEGEEEDDEQTPRDSTEVTDNLLPKQPIIVQPQGLSVDAAKLLFWKKGRADLREALQEDLEATDGDVMVTVCGPVQLLHAARRAIRDVDTPARARDGQPKVDFYEETLGS